MSGTRVRRMWLVACASGLLACTPVRDDLRRAEAAFSEARYEDVEAWAAALEPDLAAMSAAERARYYYLAGMSAFRMGKRAQARHALALCREEADASKVPLPDTWSRNLQNALSRLERP